MYYHIRIDKPGHIDEKQRFEAEAKDFDSIESALTWMQTAYGAMGCGWTIMGVPNSATTDVRTLCGLLDGLLDEDYQYVYMTMSERCPDYGKCESYCFNIFKRDGDAEA